MNMKKIETGENNKLEYRGLLKWSYIITMIFMGISGLGQMPIFKRYYIADIPGLGWTADYYITHNIHYMGAIILLALIAYTITIYLTGNFTKWAITKAGYTRIILFTGITASGILKVIANQRGVYFSQKYLILLDAVHTGFTMLLFIALIIFAIKKWGWIVNKE